MSSLNWLSLPGTFGKAATIVEGFRAGRMTSLLTSRLGSLPSCSLSVKGPTGSHLSPPLQQAVRFFHHLEGHLQYDHAAAQACRGSVLRLACAFSKARCAVQKTIRRSALLAYAAQPVCRGLRGRRAALSSGKLSPTTMTFLQQAAPDIPKREPFQSVQSPPLDTNSNRSSNTSSKHTEQSETQRSTILHRQASFTTTATPSISATSSSRKDPRQVLIDSCPLTPVNELLVAAHMARLSNICYVPEPREQLEALGLKLVAQGKTYFTAWYVADGPDLSGVQENAPIAGVNAHLLDNERLAEGDEKGEHGSSSGNGSPGLKESSKRIRYILAHGVRWGAADLDSGRMWRQIMKCWPVDFPPAAGGVSEAVKSPPREQLVAHQGVLEIAEEVYRGVKPWLGGVEKGEVSAIRFGGHSLGGSVAALLMLLAKSRHGLAAAQVSAHMFGAPAVIARKSVARKQGLPASGQSLAPTQESPHSLGPGSTSESQPQSIANSSATSVGAFQPPPAVGCPVLAAMDLPAGAIRSVVLNNDMVPRMFLSADPSYGLLLKSPLVRGLLSWREKVWGPAAVLTQDRFLFENAGLVHYIKTVGSEVLVRTLTSEQANEGLRLTMDDFWRQPFDAIKALFDHHRGHYSQDLDAAAAAAKYRYRQQRHRTADNAAEVAASGDSESEERGPHRTAEIGAAAPMWRLSQRTAALWGTKTIDVK